VCVGSVSEVDLSPPIVGCAAGSCEHISARLMLRLSWRSNRVNFFQSSKPFSILTGISTRNKRLSPRPRGLRWTPRAAFSRLDPTRAPGLHTRNGTLIAFAYRRRRKRVPKWRRSGPLPGEPFGVSLSLFSEVLSGTARSGQGRAVVGRGGAHPSASEARYPVISLAVLSGHHARLSCQLNRSLLVAFSRR
jgi:hypothetical protein